MERSLFFRITLIAVISIMSVISVSAQSDMDEFRQMQLEQFNDFRQKQHDDYHAFRKRINDEYANFVERIWNDYKAFKGVSLPVEPEPVPPIIMPEDDKEKPIENKPIIIEDVVVPIAPAPQPEPIIPIAPQPKPIKMHSIVFYGTSIKVRLDADKRFVLKGLDEGAVADAWRTMSDGRFDATILDCLELRRKFHLSDWAYLQMLYELAQDFWGEQINEATLMMSYIYCQSGYKIRLAKSENNIVMLFATKHQIFNSPYFILDGDEEYYYIMSEENPEELFICLSSFPAEKSLSLYDRENPLFKEQMTVVRHRKSANTELEFATYSEEHLLSYYSTYPSSMLNDDPMTRWAMYANAPLSNVAKKSLYPHLNKVMSELTETEKVEVLLDWVQNAFEYEYDNKVWGSDRAFFADESLYYPYCDCEDRSILFTRLVRDLVGLPCILVYYPGHLATAVCFDEIVNGDYIMLGDRRYVICDPTYINAPIGVSMPDMDNSSAKVVLLE